MFTKVNSAYPETGETFTWTLPRGDRALAIIFLFGEGVYGFVETDHCSVCGQVNRWDGAYRQLHRDIGVIS